jgi:deoxyribonuclease IV
MAIRIGPGGLGSDPEKMLAHLRDVGLTCAEVEFTHGVRMKADRARVLGKMARENGIALSVHCPYYINLLSDEMAVVAASKLRILDSCRIAHELVQQERRERMPHPSTAGCLSTDGRY